MSAAQKIKFLIASWLYSHFFHAYKILYFFFKSRKDKTEINFIKRCIKPGDTILDIGANIGFYSLLFSDLIGETGKVHCFEPDEINFNHLKSIAGKRKNIILNQKAISDSNGEINLYRSNKINVDHRTYPVKEYKDVIKVKSITIDEYSKKYPKIDFIKLDIQGAEYSAVAGLKETIVKNPKIIILFEWWSYGLKEANIDRMIFIKKINSLGLNSYRLSGNSGNLSPTDLNDITDRNNYVQYYNVVLSNKKPVE